MLPTAVRAKLARLPTYSKPPRIAHVWHVGSVTSASEAVNKLNAFVSDASPKHDLSTESWRAVWIARFGADSDKADGLAWANKDGIKTLLEDIDACAPDYAGGCDKAVESTFDGMNRDLGLSGDNGWMTFQQLMAWLGRYPVNANDPPEVREKAAKGSDGGSDFILVPTPEAAPPKKWQPGTPLEGNYVRQKNVPGIQEAPKTVTKPMPLVEKIAIGVGVPAAVGGLAAIKWGLVGLAAGGAVGLAAVGVGAYYLSRKKS